MTEQAVVESMCCRDRSTPKVDIGSSINRRNGLDPTPYPRSSGDNFAESAHMRPQPDAEALACPERSPRPTCCHPILGRPIVGRMKAPYGASLRHRDGASPFRHPNHSRKRPSQPISQCTGPAILRSQPPTFPPRPTRNVQRFGMRRPARVCFGEPERPIGKEKFRSDPIFLAH